MQRRRRLVGRPAAGKTGGETMLGTVLFGIGPTALAFFHEAETNGGIEIAAFCCARDEITAGSYCGLPLVPFEDVERLYPPGKYDMLTLFGHRRMRDREDAFLAARSKGYSLPNYVSRKANIESGVSMGAGNIVCAFAHIGFDCALGDGNIIRQHVYVGHQGRIGSHNILSPGATIGGKSTIRDLTFVGLNATVATYADIGTECLIGAGSLVLKSAVPYSVSFGSPARPVRYHRDTGVMF